MKIVLFSGDDEVLPIFRQLAEEFEITALVTHPLKPKGRGLKVEESQLSRLANERGIKVFYPNDPNSSDFCQDLMAEGAELGLLISFRHLIKERLLRLFPKGFINLHPSLLPKYRGPAPIQRALLAGEKVTGVTVIMMNEKIDAGPILAQEKIEINEEETYGELKKRLFALGAQILIETLNLLARDQAKPIPQDEKLATYAKKIEKEELLILWEKKASLIHNQIRAFSPKPGAYTHFRGKKVVILKSIVSDSVKNFPGTLVNKDGELLVCTGEGSLKIKELKIEGKKVISGKDFLNGYKPKPEEGFE